MILNLLRQMCCPKRDRVPWKLNGNGVRRNQHSPVTVVLLVVIGIRAVEALFHSRNPNGIERIYTTVIAENGVRMLLMRL
jgi:hypothetical protein